MEAKISEHLNSQCCQQSVVRLEWANKKNKNKVICSENTKGFSQQHKFKKTWF